MAGQKFQSARAVAVEVLNRCDPKKNNAGSFLDAVRHQTDQKQRVTDLVFGTLRNRFVIDKVIATFSGRPVERIQSRLLNIVRVGTYELIYCPSTEQYAVVNEAVAYAKAGGRAKQSGFVNAVLRQITRHINDRHAPLAETDACRTLPQTPTAGCQFDADFLPDRLANPAEHFSTVFSLPQWLVTNWLAEYGEQSTRQICLASNRRPSLYIRPNPLKTTIEALIEKLRNAGVDLEIVDLDTRRDLSDDSQESRIQNPASKMIRIKSPHDITQLPGFSEGLFTVQDITAAGPVRMLKNLKIKTLNLQFLDFCAAPGTKTMQLAEATAGKARIIATDIDSRRLEMVKENTARLGIKSVDVVPYDELIDSQYRFDCILLDVPCSNTGVLSRRLEARYRVSPEAIDKLSEIQAGLLDTAAKLLKPSGLVCYSTCSIQKTENTEQIERFLGKNKDFSLEKEQLTLPTAETPDHDGGYVAILVKR